MQQCQVLRQAITVWQNPRTWCYDSLPHVYTKISANVNFANQTQKRQMHPVLLLFRPLPNVGIQNFGMWGKYNLAKAYRSIKKSIANRRVKDWEASNGHTKDTTRLFHCPWHDPVGQHLYVRPQGHVMDSGTVCSHLGCGTHSVFIRFWNFSQLYQRCKSDANKQDFENKPNLTCQALSTPKTIGILKCFAALVQIWWF